MVESRTALCCSSVVTNVWYSASHWRWVIPTSVCQGKQEWECRRIKGGLHRGPGRVWELQVGLDLEGETERTVCSHVQVVPVFFSLWKVFFLYFCPSLLPVCHLQVGRYEVFRAGCIESIAGLCAESSHSTISLRTLKAIPFLCASGRLCTLPPKMVAGVTSVAQLNQCKAVLLGHCKGQGAEGNTVGRDGVLGRQVGDSFSALHRHCSFCKIPWVDP